MKRLLSILLVSTILLSTTSVISAVAVDEVTPEQVVFIEQNNSAEQTLKNFLDSKGTTGERFLFTSFGTYKDYQVCYGGYELTQPLELWARIGNYAFRLNVHMNDDKTILGLYLIKDSQVLPLNEAYDNSINDSDMSEIIKLITANSDYENYFYLYDIIDIAVVSFGDYTIRYEGITNPYSHKAAGIDIECSNIKIGDKNICVYGYEDFITSGKIFTATECTKGLYVVDKNNTAIDFSEAYEKSLIGTTDEIVKLLQNSDQSKKGYWKINSIDVTEPATTEQVTTEPTTTVPATTEPVQPTIANPSLAKKSSSLKAGKTEKIIVNNGSTSKITYGTSNSKIAKVTTNGVITALSKGIAKITVIVDSTKLTYKVKVTSNPKLSQTSVTVRKGKTVKVKITGKAKGVNNAYINTKYAKVTSSKSATTLKIKGLKKGTSTLKIKVNGVNLNLKVTVKGK